MERELWLVLYQFGRKFDPCVTLEARPLSLTSKLSWFFWAALHERPTLWACQTENWPDGLWPIRKLPSQPTMSRRLRTTEVQRLMYVMEQYLVQLRKTGLVTVVDGKPLAIGSHSKDPDCGWGRAGRSYAKGYKLHAVYGSAPLPLVWEIAPLNTSEPEVAARLIPALHGGGYILGDKAYDSNPLHDVALSTGHQLVAERKRPRDGLGHRKHSPGRLRLWHCCKTSSENLCIVAAMMSSVVSVG